MAFMIGVIMGLLVFIVFTLHAIKVSQIQMHANISNIASYISEFERYETQK